MVQAPGSERTLAFQQIIRMQYGVPTTIRKEKVRCSCYQSFGKCTAADAARDALRASEGYADACLHHPEYLLCCKQQSMHGEECH